MNKISNNREEIRKMVRSMYKDEQGNPIDLTDGQLDIFISIAQKPHSRVHTMCFTRYGKSLTTALGVLTRASTYPEKWAIVAGTKDKAKVIMNYVNAHIFDNDFTAGRFRMEKGDSAEAIRRHRNKNHITFDVGNKLIGEVFIASAKEALGLGAPNVVEDESALIDDNEHALVMRMLGDNPENNFMMKIGNPFNRNHFLKSYMDPKYHKINVDCYRGMREGRFTTEMLEEAKEFSYFGVLYENQFPSAESVDEKGWSYLITEKEIDIASGRQMEPHGILRLGLDVARGGGNFNVWTIRRDNWAKVVKKDADNDLMSVVGKTIEIIEEHHIKPEEVYIDDTGVGGGVVDRLHEKGYAVVGVKLGEKAQDSKEYINCRAELYAGKEGVANWIKRTGHLVPNKDWIELTRIRYKKDSNGRTKIEPKADIRKRGEESPDVADSLMLTFYEGGEGTYTPADPKAILEGGAGWDL